MIFKSTRYFRSRPHFASLAALVTLSVTVLVSGLNSASADNTQIQRTDGVTAGDTDASKDELVAQIDLDNGGTLEFLTLDSGMQIIAEQLPAGRHSPLAVLKRAYDATPLEVFMALSPTRAAPASLVHHHRDTRGSMPRSLAGPLRDMTGGTISAGFVDLELVGKANCRPVSDRLWFDGAVSGFGYTGQWQSQETSYERTSPSFKTTVFWSHLCNNSKVHIHHLLRRSGVPFGQSAIWHSYNIPPNHRSLAYVWDGPADWSYYTHGIPGCCGKHNFAIGMMGNW